MSEILKIIGIGFAVAVSCQLLTKYGREEQATLVSVAGVIVVVLMLLSDFSDLISKIQSVFGL